MQISFRLILTVAIQQYLSQDQVCLQTIRNFIQYIIANLDSFHSLAIEPECFSQSHLNVEQLVIFLKQCFELIDSLGIKPALNVKPSQRPLGEFKPGLLDPVATSIKTPQLLSNLRVAGSQFEGAFHLPDSFIQRLLILKQLT